jgi:hypothetical protein
MNSHRWALATLFIAAGALAQAAAPSDVPPAQVDPLAPSPEDRYLPPPGRDVLIPDTREAPHLRSVIGVVVDAGGGLTQFFGTAAMQNVNAGASWTVRTEVGSRIHIGGEIGYMGSSQRIAALGVDPRANLVSNGFEGLLRWNILTGIVQPYAGVGIGYKHFSVINTTVNTSDILDNENVAEVPGAFGLAFRAGGFVVDGRFSVCAPINSDLFPGSHATSWDLGAKVGYEF